MSPRPQSPPPSSPPSWCAQENRWILWIAAGLALVFVSYLLLGTSVWPVPAVVAVLIVAAAPLPEK